MEVEGEATKWQLVSGGSFGWQIVSFNQFVERNLNLSKAKSKFQFELSLGITHILNKKCK